MRLVPRWRTARWALCLAVVAVVPATAAAAEQPAACHYFAIDLGELSPQQSEIAPGPALHKLATDRPDCDVVAVNCVAILNKIMKDHKRYFYDFKKRLLVCLTRTSMTVDDDTYLWRIWYDVAPQDFAERIPYGRDDLKTKGSPFRGAKAAFLIEYKGPEEATDWP